ncbi:MAG: type II secretion system F family protein [Bacillota bacterium]|nr:type II secretion system F family protein [Bacillota bacterium]
MIKMLNKKTLSQFSSDIYFLLESGFSIIKTMDILSRQKSYKRLRKVFEDIGNSLKSGNNPYNSFSKYKSYFPFEFINSIKLGDDSNNLKESFKNLSQYYEEEYARSKSLKDSLAYPKMVFIMGIGVVIFLINFILPKFTETLSSLGGDMPGITKFFLNSNIFFKRYYILILIFTVLLIAAGIKFSEKIKYNPVTDYIKMKFPFIKNYYIKLQTYKYCESMLLMLSSGFNVYNSMRDSIEMSKNIYFKKTLEEVTDNINSGSGITEAFQNSRVFEDKFIELISLGEESSNLNFVIKKACFLYGREIKNLNKRVISIVEPSLILILAFIVSMIILSIMLPLFSIMDAIGGV